MTWLEIVVLAIIQGLTEFLPISSSGHLILVPALFGWDDQGLAFDVAVHVGTLSAVIGFFRHDLLRMARAVLGFPRTRSEAAAADARLAGFLVAATLPVGIVGLLMRDVIEAYLRAPAVIAATTAVFGIVLWLSARLGAQSRPLAAIRWRDALWIGVAQALALVPGTSRSGITMTAAFALGLDAQAAARFSFLLSIPVITLAGGLELRELLAASGPVDWRALAIGSVLSAVVAYLTIKYFLVFISRIGMQPFMWYRLALAAVIVYFLVPLS